MIECHFITLFSKENILSLVNGYLRITLKFKTLIYANKNNKKFLVITNVRKNPSLNLTKQKKNCNIILIEKQHSTQLI